MDVYTPLVVVLIALGFSVYYSKRGSKERVVFRERIEGEGGKIIRSLRVGMFLKSPFPGLRA